MEAAKENVNISKEEQVALFINATFPTLDSLQHVSTMLQKKEEERIVVANKATQIKLQTPQKLHQILTSAQHLQTQLSHLNQSRSELRTAIEKHNAKPGKDEMVQYLSEAQAKMTRLMAAREYMGVLLRVDELSAQVAVGMKKDVKDALVPYDELCGLWNTLRGLRGNESSVKADALSHMKTIASLPTLINFVKKTVVTLHEDLKSNLAKKLSLALEGIGWPGAVKESAIPEAKLGVFRRAFGQFLMLRSPEGVDETSTQEPLLGPIEIMLQQPILHFKYHFSGTKLTNRLDKPEWAFTRILTIIRDHTEFLTGPVQRLLNEYGLRDYDAKNEFTRGLLRALTQKLRADAPKLLQEPRHLSHTINETLIFDKTLRETDLYTTRHASGAPWKGCVSVFTDNPVWFKSWLAAELDDAKFKFDEIVLGGGAWDLAFESMADIDELKVTKSAEAIVILLEAVTDRYKLLPQFPHRIAFFSDIQLALLEDYLQVVRNGLDAYVNPYSARSPSSEPETVVQSLETMCRYASSLHYVATILREWGEQTFYLMMWEDMQKREDHPDTDGMLFDEVVTAYDTLMGRVREGIVEDVVKRFVDAAWHYDKKRNWSKPPSTQTPTTLDISQELCEALDVLSLLLPILADNLPSPLFQSALREIAAQIDRHLFNSVVLRGEFNEAGGAQFRMDMVGGLWRGVFRKWNRKPENLFRRLKDATIVLSLPSELPPNAQDPNNVNSLSIVATTIMADDLNKSARMLDKLGIHRLAIGEVAEVIQRRVELGTLDWDT